MILLLIALSALPCPAQSRTALDERCAFEQQATPEQPAPGPPIASVLARPEFVRAQQVENLWALRVLRVLEWLIKLLQRREAEDYAVLTRFLVLALASTIAAYGLYRVFRRRYSREPKSARSAGPEALVLDAPEAHLARAQALLGSAPRESLREGLLALLSALERRRFARPERVKTNRELGLELELRGASTTVTETVRPLLADYDAVFYSLVPVSSEQVEPFLKKVRMLERELALRLG